MYAAEKEYLDMFKKQEGPEKRQSFYVGKWMEILYKFGRVCPEWKDMIFASKMLFKADEPDEDEVDEEEQSDSKISNSVHSLDFRTGRVKIYQGKQGLRLQENKSTIVDGKYVKQDNSLVLAMIREGYMSLAKEMRLELDDQVDQKRMFVMINFDDLEVVNTFAHTSSIEFYQGLFKKDLETVLPMFVVILEKSKNANRVDVKVTSDNLFTWENDSFRIGCYHLMPILQIETMKHVKFEFESVPFAKPLGRLYSDCHFRSSLDLDFMENCLSAYKIGEVEKVEIVLRRKHALSKRGFCHMKVFKYENLNKTNMPDFIRKFLGKHYKSFKYFKKVLAFEKEYEVEDYGYAWPTFG